MLHLCLTAYLCVAGLGEAPPSNGREHLSIKISRANVNDAMPQKPYLPAAVGGDSGKVLAGGEDGF